MSDVLAGGAGATLMERDCLHIAPSDAPFTARMRFHQSWYRRHVLGLRPGPNPAAHGALYGSQLTLSDAEAGGNFLNPAIYAAAERRLAAGPGGVEAQRLRANLLSSQPMCFNLWAPLADDLALATRLVRALPGLPSDLTITGVAFEFAPDRTLHLNDASAFDVFLEYSLPDGRRGFVGVETKLTEPFSPERYGFDERYSRWLAGEGWWWLPGAESSFDNSSYNQLWRNHLLAFAMLRQPDATYAEGYCAVVYPTGDKACAEAIAAYRPLLRPEGAPTLLVWQLEAVVAAWTGRLETTDERAWLAAFHLRYLDLPASEAAWQAFKELRG